ncbi:MAG: helix-turn-helix transcriptional regulator [Solirubrobacteraceae bacterium]|jgi:transcriptional regulator with XRE-family HTH domain
MKIESQLTDEAVLRELGERLAALRLGRNMTQLQLAASAGVARSVIQNVERGGSVTTANLVRLLRELDLLDALERLIPQPTPSPVAELRLRGHTRRRAAGSRGGAEAPADRNRPWRWGDES